MGACTDAERPIRGGGSTEEESTVNPRIEGQHHMNEGTIAEGQILTGVMFNEPMRVVTTRRSGGGAVIAGTVGQNSGQFREVTLTQDDIANLNAIDPNPSYDGDGELLNLALQAYSLGIAHEFDPYFGLSISRVGPGKGGRPRAATTAAGPGGP